MAQKQSVATATDEQQIRELMAEWRRLTAEGISMVCCHY